MARIPLFYRIFFLYIDPLVCLSGIYLFFFDHNAYIRNGVPSIISSRITSATHPSQLVEYLTMALGSYSVFVFAMQVLLLHQFKHAPQGLNVKIWRIVQFGILLIDIGLLYGFCTSGSKAALDVNSWNSKDWANNGILGILVVIRSAFLVGLGGVGSEKR